MSTQIIKKKDHPSIIPKQESPENQKSQQIKTSQSVKILKGDSTLLINTLRINVWTVRMELSVNPQPLTSKT